MMEDEQTSTRRGQFLNKLFEGTTSYSRRKEILAAFEQVERWPESSQACFIYQGCGCDLITLACSTVDTHILSDISPDVLSQLDGKFRQLADSSFIHELRKGWTVIRIWECRLARDPRRCIALIERALDADGRK